MFPRCTWGIGKWLASKIDVWISNKDWIYGRRRNPCARKVRNARDIAGKSVHAWKLLSCGLAPSLVHAVKLSLSPPIRVRQHRVRVLMDTRARRARDIRAVAPRNLVTVNKVSLGVAIFRDYNYRGSSQPAVPPRDPFRWNAREGPSFFEHLPSRHSDLPVLPRIRRESSRGFMRERGVNRSRCDDESRFTRSPMVDKLTRNMSRNYFLTRVCATMLIRGERS